MKSAVQVLSFRARPQSHPVLWESLGCVLNIWSPALEMGLQKAIGHHAAMPLLREASVFVVDFLHMISFSIPSILVTVRLSLNCHLLGPFSHLLPQQFSSRFKSPGCWVWVCSQSNLGKRRPGALSSRNKIGAPGPGRELQIPLFNDSYLLQGCGQWRLSEVSS